MSVSTMGRRIFRWYRRTEWLMEARQITAAMGPDVDKCPLNDGFVELRVRGDNQVGTVTLSGTLDGVPETEVIDFDGSSPVEALQLSCKRGLCVNLINTTGFGANTTLEAKYTGPDGSAIAVNCLLEPCVQAHREYGGRGTWPNTVPGTHETTFSWIAFDDVYRYNPRPGDFFVEVEEDESNGPIWEVIGRPEHLGSLRRHHWELDVRLQQHADLTIVSSV